MDDSDLFDCLIVGGGVAGMSAALSLGRARRRVLLSAGGPPRNAPASHSHNFFTRDGTPPLELLAIAREQLTPYETVAVQDTMVESIRPSGGERFEAKLANGREIVARVVILATGVRDDLDSLPGLKPLWGHSAFACPFCHGWECRDRPWAVVVENEHSVAMVKMARSWTSKLAVLGNGSFEPDAHLSARMKALSIPFYQAKVVALEGRGGELAKVVLSDGTSIEAEALLYRPPHTQRSGLAVSLGCELDGMGYIKTTQPFGTTSVKGVFAVGDAVTPLHSVAAASASGSKAGGGVQHLLAELDFGLA